MTPRITLSITTWARLACVVGLLTGCATVPQDAERAAANSAPVSADSTQIAGQPALGKPTARLGAARAPAAGLPVVVIPTLQQLPQAIDLTSETDDLLQRMRNGFSMPDISGDLVLYHQQWFLNRPDYLRRVTERSSRYLHHIIEELEKRGMPMELALLPMVESAYNPLA